MSFYDEISLVTVPRAGGTTIEGWMQYRDGWRHSISMHQLSDEEVVAFIQDCADRCEFLTVRGKDDPTHPDSVYHRHDAP